MKIPIYQVDAFTSRTFAGNPAAVCLLESWPDDALLQNIAAENNLSETAFVVPNEIGYDIRWFTPRTEVALCGHATLASAFVLFEIRGHKEHGIRFSTRRSGALEVTRRGELYVLDFPARPAHAIDAPPGLFEALGIAPHAVYGSAEDVLVLLENESAVRAVAPDFFRLESVPCRGIIVSASGEDCDFISRFFAPRVGVNEDPVTGSAHSVLVPYWSDVLGKTELRARQLSQRGGELLCTNQGDRVLMAGSAVLYMSGTIAIADAP